MRNLLILLSVLALTMIGWAIFTAAPAHEAPTGWAYDTVCCSNKDCAVEVEEVRATDSGWLITRLGITVSYGSRKLKKSGDQDFHSCFTLNQRDDPDSLLCLYVPPQSY
jgi:hypothetical protein